jgi:histidinol-phosphatase
MVDPIVNRWDVAPMLTILPEAGGVFTDLTGIVTVDGGDAIATNPILHGELLAAIGRSPGT